MDDNTRPARKQSFSLTLLSIAVGLVAFVLVAATIENLGITADEPGYYRSCLQQLEWFGKVFSLEGPGNWKEPFSAQVIDQHWNYEPLVNVHPPFYKLCSSASLALFSRWLGPMVAYRFAPAAMFAVLVGLLCWCVGRRYGPAAGVWAAGSFALMPRIFGHAHIGATDMPLTALWFASAVLFHRGLKSRKCAAGFAVIYGLALSTKLTALVIPIPLAIFVILSRRFKQAAWPVGLALVISPLVMVALNPYWWHETLGRLYAFFLQGSSRSQYYHGMVYYLGKQYPFYLPWHHPLVYTALTVPPVVLAGFCYGLFRTLRRPFEDMWAAHMLLHWLALVVVMMLPGSPGHDGVRLFLPSFAFIAAVSAVGFYHFAPWLRKIAAKAVKCPEPVSRKAAHAVLLCILLVPAGIVLARIHPYELSYYNILAGGLAGANRLGLETTYWWDPVNRQACQQINEQLPDSSCTFTRNNDHFHFLQQIGWIKPSLRFATTNLNYYMIYFRQGLFNEEDWLIANHSTPLMELRKDSVPLLAIYPFRKCLEEVLDEFNRELERPDPRPRLHYEAAVILNRLGDIESMVLELKKYLHLEPENFEAHMRLAGVYLEGKKPEIVIKLLQRVAGNIQDPVSWNFGMAEACNQLGNDEKAIFYYEKVLEEKSLDPGTNFNLGQLYYRLGNREKAMEHYTLLHRVQPENIYPVYHLGKISQEAEELDKARYYYEKVLEIEPGNRETLTNLGILDFRAGDMKGAERFFLQVLASDSLNSYVNTLLANLYIRTGRSAGAERYFRLASESDPENAQAHLGLGVIYSQRPECWRQALDELRTAVRLSPGEAGRIERDFLIPLEKKLSKSVLKN
ncbi:MAG: tetratricopeptide repeat protein [Gemmatimonadota bacterium]|nr:tetratricopeptide repeat protein [Gemmatimonadota bacterium]